MTHSKKYAFSGWPAYEHKVPVMIENKQHDYIMYGLQNEYPYYLLQMFKRSAKHNAIINGKVQYIIGKGWAVKEDAQLLARAKAEKFLTDINEYEDLNDLTDKLALDLEIFNGFAVAVTWAKDKKSIARLEHYPMQKVRVDKQDKWFQVADWYDALMIQKFPSGAQVERIPAFDPDNRVGKQLLYYRCYAPGVEHYPLPNYMGGLAWIEADVEVANFHINNLKNGFVASAILNLNNGVPEPEEQEEVERQVNRKFSGTNNAGRLIVNFNDDVSKAPTITTLQASDLDKQFDILNKTIQQEIFVAHNVVNPMLFGVKTEGQLGGRAELVEAYELFKNTYINDRQQKLERVINYLASFNSIDGLYLQPTEPITEQLSETVMSQVATKDELREKLGLPILQEEELGGARLVADAINALSPLVANKVLESMSPNEIRALAALPPKAEGQALPADAATGAEADPAAEQQMTNSVLRSLTGREYQGMMRIVRQFTQGKISKEQAALLLQNGYGLQPEEVNIMLGEDADPTTEFSADDDQEEMLKKVAALFGANESDYVVLSSTPMRFESDEQLVKSERMMFAVEPQNKALDKLILDYRDRNPRATVEQIAKAIDRPLADVAKRIQYLIDNNRYPVSRTIDQKTKDAPTSEPILEVRYKYNWAPEFKGKASKTTSRKFCQVMMDMASSGKLYTREDINQISAIMGYSVWTRRGGWYTVPNTDIRKPQCRHVWEQQLVMRKGNQLERVTE